MVPVLSSDSRDLQVQPLPGVYLEKTDDHVFCRFEHTREVFSSAVLGGGWSKATQFLNVKVDPHATSYASTPQQTLLDYCATQNWSGSTIGMMTAASMNSLRYGIVSAENVNLLILLTSGLANARRAGDSAADCSARTRDQAPGTINIAVVADARFSEAAMAELMMMTTEAKCAALQAAGVRSPVSGAIATGTGTDSVAIFNGADIHQSVHETSELQERPLIQYCGKHTHLGEVFARGVIALLSDSVAEDQALKSSFQESH
ncbi:MAG: adenosylcobinamide amidohydrolase [Pseudomonadota bacterium]|nr:adenosylcobinamide amidohydrolase [Pseudomonadota bacterium]